MVLVHYLLVKFSSFITNMTCLSQWTQTRVPCLPSLNIILSKTSCVSRIDQPGRAKSVKRFERSNGLYTAGLWSFCHVVVKTGKNHGNNHPGKNKFLPGGKNRFFACWLELA